MPPYSKMSTTEEGSTVDLKTFLPTIIVFLSFLATLAVYTVLSIQGSDIGPIEQLVLVLGGALGGIAAPTVLANRSSA